MQAISRPGAVAALGAPAFAAVFPLPDNGAGGAVIRLDFVAVLRQAMHFFAVMRADEDNLQPPCRDPKDNKFLALAQVCRADALVSSDDDLVVLNPWRGIPVLSPTAFLPLVDG